MILVPIPTEHFEEAWPLIKPLAQLMADRVPDDWPLEETYRQVIEGEMQAWIAWEPEEKKAYGFAGTKLATKPSGRKFYEIACCSGVERQRWIHLIDGFEDEARKLGCDALQIEGRDWSRELDSRWHKRREMTLTLELEP